MCGKVRIVTLRRSTSPRNDSMHGVTDLCSLIKLGGDASMHPPHHPSFASKSRVWL